MISVILYGRNDSHGYNLHKRAALSLNCIAHVLDAPGDEIIFVDYNTPDDFPTFPEAIADTLTERAKKLLRILRVRPHHHERFKDITALVALEPIARNVGVRRSNPENRWILSTNTDMIFVPRRSVSLSEIAAGLNDAYYHLPRFELPEALWESLDRNNPEAVIGRLREWGPAFHLDEMALLPYPETKYDAPGDFQLILRADLWRIHGFHEEMILGWHVDSNLAKRLALLPRPLGEVFDSIYGYHCDHYRQLTALHAQHGQRNDVQTYFLNVKRADLPGQADTWGLADETIEEFSVGDTSRQYLAALRATIPSALREPTKFQWTGADAEYDYSVERVFPFLMSCLASYPRDRVAGWYGAEPDLLSRFAKAWSLMGFGEPILVDDEATWLGPQLPANCRWLDPDVLNLRAHFFIFDFGRAAAKADCGAAAATARRNTVLQRFGSAIEAEVQRLADVTVSPRRFIGVNPIVTGEVAQAFEGRIAMAVWPNGTHVKEGIVSTSALALYGGKELNCLPLLLLGNAAAYGPAPNHPQKRAIHARAGVRGVLACGPYVAVLPGLYEAAFEFYAAPASNGAQIHVDVAADKGEKILGRKALRPRFSPRLFHRASLEPLGCVIRFEVKAKAGHRGENAVEFRVFSPGTVRFCLVGLRVKRIAAAQ
jgi:hypothetical protein